jgi:NTE family protein
MELLIRTFMITLSREYISEDFWLSTIVIDSGDVSPMDLKLSAEDKQNLYQSGYNTTLAVLPAKLERQQARRDSQQAMSAAAE